MNSNEYEKMYINLSSPVPVLLRNRTKNYSNGGVPETINDEIEHEADQKFFSNLISSSSSSPSTAASQVTTIWRVCPLHVVNMVHDSDDLHNNTSLNSPPTQQRRNIRTYREYESIFITATFSEFSSWFHGHPLAKHHPFAQLPSHAERQGSLYYAC